ncbi:MAG: tRNA pseudouridine(38-40) synthase TruA [Nevskiales bacterium]
MRYAAGVEYVGTAYSGWQIQGHAPSVQAVIESALTRVADAPIKLTAAGRTDAGVHALGQVVHFDTAVVRRDIAWLFGGNAGLPPDINLRWVQAVAEDFHARHTALSRRYVYLIHNAPARSSLLHRRAAWCRQPLDEARMHAAAQHLLGEQDFSAFRAIECQSRTPMRNVLRVQVSRRGQIVELEIEANAFLHHMVRNIVGSLIEVGRDLRPIDWTRELLAGRDRRSAGATAPAHGLYLAQVRYPERFELPDSPGIVI